jgi:cytochrome c-type biogenesis protein CcmH/NrfG
MSLVFFAGALFVTIAAVALSLSPLFRDKFKSEQQLGEWRNELKSLIEAKAAGGLDSALYAAQRAAIGEQLMGYIGRKPKRAGPAMSAALAIAILVPLAAFGGYKWIGATPDVQARGSTAEVTGAALATSAIQAAEATQAAAPVDHGVDMQAAIRRLADKLRQNPDDAQGWALLGRTYKATQHYPEARDAFKHAVDAAPGDAGLEREYAAAETPNEDLAETDDAQPQECDVPTLQCDVLPGASHGSPRITVNVAIAPNLRAKVLPGDTLFVFAKAAQGPAQPLAIARLTAAELPATVTLTDEMSMMPNLNLSKYSQVVLGARISKSGNAIAQSGDLQILSAAVSNSRAEPVQLTIDQTVE